jgi:fibronectin-binding autotransporter adhesin
MVGGSNVTFAGSSFGHTFSNTAGLTVSSGSFSLTGAPNVNWTNVGTIFFNANATVSNGNDLSGPGLGVGNSSAAVATFTGFGTTLNVLANGIGIGNGNTGTLTFADTASGTSGAIDMATAAVGTGNLNVQSGATLSAQGLSMANSAVAGKVANVTVTGTGSTLINSGAINIGAGSLSSATMTIGSGGAVTTNGGNLSVNATGLLDIQSGGTFTLNGNATVNGTLQRAADGTFSWATGKTMTVQNGGDLFITGGYSLPTSASVTVTGAGSSLAQTTSGSLTVSGGSALTIAADATVDAFAERISDGGTAGTVNHTGGMHNVGGGTNPLIIGNAAGATGTYNLSGGGLTVTNNVAGGATVVGYNGAGNFVQTGGWQYLNGSNTGVVIGLGATGVGTYSISNGSLDCGSIDLGRDTGASGTLTVSQSGSGTFVDAMSGPLQLGLSARATGTINANAGFVGGKGIFVGGTSTAAGGTGVLKVAGGTVVSAILPGLPNSGQCRVWNTAGSAINLSDGALQCDALLTSGNPSRFHWTGSGRLYITGDGGFDVSAAGPLGATLTIDGGKQLNVTKTTNIAAGASIAVLGSSAFLTGSLTGAGALSSDGSFMFVGNDNTSTTFTGSIAGFGGLSKIGTGKLTLKNTRIDALGIHGGSIAIIPSGGAAASTSTCNNLTIGPGGKLDIGDNKLVAKTMAPISTWNGTAYAGVAGLIQSGYNGGNFLGSGIVTTQPDATGGNPLTSIGYATATQTGHAGGTFGGQPVSTGDLLVMYTYAGDANLDGKINIDDYGNIDSNVSKSGTVFGWFAGDFNYDGKINIDDYGIIDSNINRQAGVFPTAGGMSVVDGVDGVAAVPEPSLVGLAALGLLARRRRRRQP